MSSNVLGIDLGGTKILAGVVDESGQVLSRVQVDTGAAEGPVAVLDRIVMAARAAMANADGLVIGAAVGAPGPIDTKRGLLLSPPNLPGWQQIPLPAMLSQRLSLPVAFENDANMAAYGEYRFGAGQNRHSLLYVTVSTGVGAGTIIGGRIWHGSNGLAGEIGHITVAPKGPLCGCGRQGCLEAVASGPAMARLAGQPSGKAVIEAARKGDPTAMQVVEESTGYLAVVLGGMVGLLDPTVIVVGGSVALGAGDLMLAPLRRKIQQMTWRPAFEPLTIVPAALGSDAGLIGAAATAWNRVRKP